MTEKQFIAEMKEIRDDVSSGDIQGMVEAFTMTNGGNDDEILNQIYSEEV